MRPEKMTHFILYTIGYQGLTPDQFLDRLLVHGVSLLADIRQKPASRKAGFSKDELSEQLAGHGIDYAHYAALGAPPDLRKQLYRTGDHDRFRRDFRRSLADKTEYLQAILSHAAWGKTVALMCYEHDPDQCHRKIVAEEIMTLDSEKVIVENIQ